MPMRERERISAGRLVVAVRSLSLGALALASASAVEYYARAHAFCAPGSGCDLVRSSQLGRTIGPALPALGVLGFASVVIACLSGRTVLRQLGLAGAVTGGVVGLVLLLLQRFAIGALCPICAAVDVSAIGAALCAVPLLRREASWPALGSRAQRVWRAAIVLAAGLPAAWAFSRPVHVPSYVRAVSRPGTINVFELSDFECPFCRAMHPALKAAMAPHAGRVHFVRKSFPLPGHPHARAAARAYLCAEDEGKGEVMADWLFASPDLSLARAELHAEAFGLDRVRFAACARDPATDRRIERDMLAVQREGFDGLPLVFIEGRAFLGFDASAGPKPYAAALARAAAGESNASTSVPWVLLALATSVALLLPALR